jgi:hypothetical protein
MLVEVPVALPLRTEVTIRVGEIEISTKATVRHCRQVYSWFRVGLKFHNILLAEHVTSLDTVLIKSLRCADNPKQFSLNGSRLWNGVLRKRG